MIRNYVSVTIDQDRDIEAEGLDAFGNLPDLLFAVVPWVGGIRFQTVYNQTALDMVNKTIVLMYKIIFQVIGYEGKFTDYGTVGYPLKDYPPVKLLNV